MNVYPAPVSGPSVEWPVWVGNVPRLAAAFQPRTEVRLKIEAARSRGSEVVLSGAGGVGKSQLAAALARDLRDQERSGEAGLDVLVWVKAVDPDQVIAVYAEAAEQLQLPGRASDDSGAAARVFLKWLETAGRRWLVVLDDITDPEIIEPWWPDSGVNGWVLATTRRDDAQLSGQGRTFIKLGLYTADEARAYLKRRLTDAGHPHLHDPERAGDLAGELGHLPLALGHAAAYLINKRRTMTAYLTLLRDTRSRLGDLLPPNADTEGYGQAVTTALISLDAVIEADSTRLARPLLQFISLMDPLGHPSVLWTTPPALRYLITARPPQRRWLRRYHPPISLDEVPGALECLRTYALIAQDTDTAPIRMHALTARAVRETIPVNALPATARTAADAMSSLWPVLDHEDRELSAVLRANIIHLERHTYPALWRPTTHPCIRRASRSLKEAGLYQQAIEYNQRSLRRSQDIHGSDDPITIAFRSHLADSYRSAGRVQKALDLSEQVLADLQRVLGADHPDTLSARNNLALAYRDAGRVPEAIGLQERVLADLQRILGADHPNIIGARNNLANSYRSAGRLPEAIELQERVLADRERILGADHPDTLSARNNLANSYGDVGRVPEAMGLQERVLADRERILGADHPTTLATRNNLAIHYGEVGRMQEALDLSKQVLADFERVLGADHPDTLSARNNLAISFGEVGRSQEAIELQEKALADLERIQGTDHPDTLNARNNLAISFREVGRSQEAIELQEKALADLERIQGTDHPDTL
ncbi:FxSxx-COOH system tetratricopeptide repeat protein, partial [Streptomyces canus]|uniref:FxSxx-COOH system tetratricopeptide repeat protein n=1 Tax=Streptomyces canus TaxID=58343 RepID=UPI0033E3D10A